MMRVALGSRWMIRLLFRQIQHRDARRDALDDLLEHLRGRRVGMLHDGGLARVAITLPV